MALVRSTRQSGHSADQDLRDAVSEFRKLLSPDEAAALSSSIASKSSNGNSVVAVTRQIEENVASRKSRLYTARLQKFLDAVNDFTNIIDAVVGFGPSIAATIWGVVKATLLLACNAASYFEKVVAMFKEIGDYSPIYAEYAVLFPDSAPLQQALCDYFVHVVRFCGDVVKIARASSAMVLLRAAIQPFEARFGSIKENLQSTSRKVRSEVELAAHKMHKLDIELSEGDRVETSRHRRLLSMFMANTARHLEDAQNMKIARQARCKARTILRIKNKLLLINHRKAHRRVYKMTTPGTAVWFQAVPDFRSWYENNHKTALLLSGPMGCGKSAVAANVVQYVEQHRSQETYIAYWFCDDSMPDSLRANVLIKSLMGQLICNSLDGMTQDVLDTIEDVADAPDVEINFSELLPFVRHDKIHYIIIDNFDYCEAACQDAILDALRRLYETGMFKMLLTTRTTRRSQTRADYLPWTHYIHVAQHLTEADMRTFVQSSLDKKLEDGTLSLTDPELIGPIYEHLLAGAEGMFLWAHLMIEELTFCENDSVIVEILESPPWELSKMFASMLQRVSQSSEWPFMRMLLAWMLGARRALTVPELREALAIRIGQPHLEKRISPRTLMTAIMATRGLISFDEDDSSVRPVHHSFRLFLLESNHELNQTDMTFDQHALQVELTGLCLTYLLTDSLVKQVAKNFPERSLSPYLRAIPAMSHSVVKRESSNIARAILQTRQIPVRSTRWSRLGEARTSLQQTDWALSQIGSRLSVRSDAANDLADHVLLKYAQENWSAHAATLEPETDPAAWKLLRKVFLGRYLHIPQPWHETNPDGIPQPWLNWQPFFRKEQLAVLCWAVAHRNLAIVRVALYEYLQTCEATDFPLIGRENQLALVAKTFLQHMDRQMADLVCSLWRQDSLTWPVASDVSIWLSVRFDLDRYVGDTYVRPQYLGEHVTIGRETLFELVDDRERLIAEIVRTQVRGLADLEIAAGASLSVIQLCIAYGSHKSLRKLLGAALGGHRSQVHKSILGDTVLIALLYGQTWFLDQVLEWSPTTLDTQAAIHPSLVHLAGYRGQMDLAALLALLSPDFWQGPIPPGIYCALLRMPLQDAAKWEYLVQRSTANEPDVRNEVLQRISRYSKQESQQDLSAIVPWMGRTRDDFIVDKVRAANLHGLHEEYTGQLDLAGSLKHSRSLSDFRRK